MTSKPTITCSGHDVWVQRVKSYCFGTLAMEPVQWVRQKDTGSKRSRLVHVDATFQNFTIHSLPLQRIDAIDKPVAHIFVTVNDLEHFKKHAKKPFENWHNNLIDRRIDDWLLVLINEEPMKMKDRFLKLTVFDIIKATIKVKNFDKRVHYIQHDENPDLQKESWSKLLSVLRDLVLTSYDNIISAYEERICCIREQRYETDWNYFSLFSLQEDLACLYESLCLYEDALTQYDELEAIFMQCIDAHRGGERLMWLTSFSQLGCDSIHSVFITNYLDYERRNQVHSHCVCLLDFRAYLLSRQCALLLMLGRGEEVAVRAHSAIICALHEAKYLKMPSTVGLVNSWIFLGCMQVIQSCERFCNPLGPGRAAGAIGSSNNFQRDQQDSSQDDRRSHASSMLSVEEILLTRNDNDSFINETIGSNSNNLSQGEAIAELYRLACVHFKIIGQLCGLWPNKNDVNDDSKTTIVAPIMETTDIAQTLLQALMVSNEIVDGNKNDNNYQQEENDNEIDAQMIANPEIRLRRCLRSKRYFLDSFSEMMVLCIAILKHNNRLRMAHLLSVDLADFLRLTGQLERAEKLYGEALKVYRRECWSSLEFFVRKKIAECHECMLDKPHKFVKSCLHLSSSFSPPPYQLCLPLNQRIAYWNAMEEAIKTIKSDQSSLKTTLPIYHYAYPIIEVVALHMLLPSETMPQHSSSLSTTSSSPSLSPSSSSMSPSSSTLPILGYRLEIISYSPVDVNCRLAIRANQLNDNFDPDLACQLQQGVADDNFTKIFLSQTVENSPNFSLSKSHAAWNSVNSLDEMNGNSGAKQLLPCDCVFHATVFNNSINRTVLLRPGHNEFLFNIEGGHVYWPRQLVVYLFDGVICLLNNQLNHNVILPSMEKLKYCLPSISVDDLHNPRILQVSEMITVTLSSGFVAAKLDQVNVVLSHIDSGRVLSRAIASKKSIINDNTKQRQWKLKLSVKGENQREQLKIKIEGWRSLCFSLVFQSAFRYQVETCRAPTGDVYIQLMVALSIPCEGSTRLGDSQLTVVTSSSPSKSSSSLSNNDKKSSAASMALQRVMKPSSTTTTGTNELVSFHCPFVYLWCMSKDELLSLKSLHKHSQCDIFTFHFTTHLYSFPWRRESPTTDDTTQPIITRRFGIPLTDFYK